MRYLVGWTITDDEKAIAQRSLPYGDPNDPGYRRLRYVRYADDFLLAFAGSKREAQEITSKIRAFLRELSRVGDWRGGL